MQDFVHLHVHTQYSLLDGQASVSRLVDKAMKDGMKGIAVTDHGNMFGIKEFYNYVNKKNSGPRGEIKDLKKRIAELERELLQARCRLAAYAAGVDPELAEDAVTLAIGAAQREGEVTEESVTRAMAGVLQRHPDWKNGGRGMAGFRLGADTDPAAIPAPGGEPEPEKRRWNRFK